ncbi:hypothetical protein BOTBODRAFT_114017, partial [Botryobasidium botryosum FD-172 SS1]
MDIMRALLSSGADIETKDYGGDTPLLLASASRLSFPVRFLISSGANTKATGTQGNRTSEHVIGLLRDSDGALAVAALLDAGIDPNAKDGQGETLLGCAAWLGSTSAVISLLEAGSNPKAPGWYQRQPLHYAAELMHNPDALFKAGADVRAKDKYRQTPLSSATLAGSPQAIQLLLKAGADPNERDAKLHGPLHFTSHVIDRPGGPDAIMALIHAGADVNAADDSGKTPLYMAAENGAAGVVLLLHKAGAR